MFWICCLYYKCFSCLDTTIHPIQQSYNKPQQLTSKINLAEITREISIDPPKELFLLQTSYNVNNSHSPQVVNPTIKGKMKINN